MKKQIITMIMGMMILTGWSNLQAQTRPARKNKAEMEEKLNALRKQYFNEKLALSDAEQKAFWPLYDEYKAKDKALRDSFQRKYKKNDVVFMDDKKAEEYLNAMLKLKDDQHNLFKEYIAKFRKVLPVKKVAMIPMLERDFKREIMKKAMHHGESKPDGPGDE